jgi:Fe-S cluster assembly scaffold protein SufB
LRARGLSEKTARSLMTQAFISEVVDKVEQKEVRDFIQGNIAILLSSCYH